MIAKPRPQQALTKSRANFYWIFRSSDVPNELHIQMTDIKDPTPPYLGGGRSNDLTLCNMNGQEPSDRGLIHQTTHTKGSHP